MNRRRRKRVAIGAGAVILAVIAVYAAQSAIESARAPDYPPGWYGPRWKNRRPPGYPAAARGAGPVGGARALMASEAQRVSNGPAWLRMMDAIGRNESNWTSGLPANNADFRCIAGPAGDAAYRAQRCTIADGRRPGGSLITAGGPLQFNIPAWQAITGQSRPWWEFSALDNIRRPVEFMGGRYRAVRAAGCSDAYAARGSWLWHRTPVAFNNFIRSASRAGCAAAWAQVPAAHRSKIDRVLA